MPFKNFFKKKSKFETQTAERLTALESLNYNENFAEISGRLRKIENTQKETSLQLEAINDFLQNGDEDERGLLDALIAINDNIENFYRFAADNADSPLYEQAQIMWDAAKNTAESAGLEIIEDEREPFDFHRHSAESVSHDDTLPNGYIIKVLKCGYNYKDKIIRRALVTVNKIENKTETGA